MKNMIAIHAPTICDLKTCVFFDFHNLGCGGIGCYYI